jgi:hypothetical protein
MLNFPCTFLKYSNWESKEYMTGNRNFSDKIIVERLNISDLCKWQ